MLLRPVGNCSCKARFSNNEEQPESRFFQLATNDRYGYPAVRTVVYRGFKQDSTSLLLTSGTRTDKIQHIRKKATTSVCWYFAQTRAQFRFQTQASFFNSANH
ncbi:hypothetical protein CA267_000830 [Alteromonas pelagimontana]|uniref:Pyridoxamine 5'-phosphate oxidase Alr4036 family FMN-binding domain-containing protein n=1 Tax=Alteromonas pelagimontana TaxID=1858656 RepID=A0A6M4M8F2_9ALTE|nr:hypothetical protein CA267_000830 [Alteromonas pelagimontana]